jgi:DNA-binding FadR family transcriptional regulator
VADQDGPGPTTTDERGEADDVTTPLSHLAFARLEDEDRPAAVTRRLRQAIALGLLHDGAALPSETDLAGQFGVSTITLRSALAELRAGGYLETRRGRGGGSFVRVPADGQDQRSDRQLALGKLDIEDLRDLRDYHVALSGSAAALAAQRANGHVLDRLERLAVNVAVGTTTGELVRADSRFHIEIAATTRSVRLARAELAVQAEVGSLLWLPGARVRSPQQAADAHAQIVAAIGGGDPEAARSLASEHVASELNHLIQLRIDLSAGGDDRAH